MTNLTPYSFDGQQVRAVVGPDGRPLFILADLCKVLDLGNPSMVAQRLDPDDLSTAEVIDSMGRRQKAHAVTEPGAIDVTLDSRKPDARRFRRWLTHDVVPQIMQTGQYSATPALTGAELLATAVIEADRMIREKDATIAVLTPRAEAWDVMADAAGDYAVDEAAKILSRDPAITIGRTRLFTFMGELGWLYRHGARNRWHAYQTAVEAGRLVERVSAAFLNQRTGEMEVPAPTIRVTPKGLQALRDALLKEDAA